MVRLRDTSMISFEISVIISSQCLLFSHQIWQQFLYCAKIQYTPYPHVCHDTVRNLCSKLAMGVCFCRRSAPSTRTWRSTSWWACWWCARTSVALTRAHASSRHWERITTWSRPEQRYYRNSTLSRAMMYYTYNWLPIDIYMMLMHLYVCNFHPFRSCSPILPKYETFVHSNVLCMFSLCRFYLVKAWLRFVPWHNMSITHKRNK